MRNLNVYVSNNESVVNLDEPILDPNTLTLRHATVFWRYENITSKNNTIVYGGSDIVLSKGYWDFELIRERLSAENIILTRNVPDRKCGIMSKGKPVDLKSLGVMLGFDKDTLIPADTQMRSPRPVDVLQGLRYINIRCDAVDVRDSTDTVGGRSTILASLPIVSYEVLNSSATNYFNVNNVVNACSASIYRLAFSIDSNVDKSIVGVDALLNIVVE